MDSGYGCNGGGSKKLSTAGPHESGSFLQMLHDDSLRNGWPIGADSIARTGSVKAKACNCGKNDD
jgi:hypothetical protein